MANIPNLVFVPVQVDLAHTNTTAADAGNVIREPLAQPFNLLQPPPGPQLWPVKQ